MNRQRGMGLIELAIIGALVLGAIAALKMAWNGFTDNIGQPYYAKGTAAQLGLDQPKMDKMEARALRAEDDASKSKGETAQCQSVADKAGKAVKEANRREQIAMSNTRLERAAHAADKAKDDARAAEFEMQANAKPLVDQACEDMRTKLRATQKKYLDSRK